MFCQPIFTFYQSLHECIVLEKLIVSPQGAVFAPVYLNQSTILSPFLIPSLLFSLPPSISPSQFSGANTHTKSWICYHGLNIRNNSGEINMESMKGRFYSNTVFCSILYFVFCGIGIGIYVVQVRYVGKARGRITHEEVLSGD